MRALGLLLVLFVAACSGGSSSPPPLPPVSSSPIMISMAASVWTINAAPTIPVGMPLNPTQDSDGGFYVDLPPAGGGLSLNYLVMPAFGKINGTPTATLTITLSPGATIVEANPCGDPVAANVSLYFQQAGDDWSGLPGSTEYYRWWAVHAPLNINGTITLQAGMDPSLWSDVQGHVATTAPSQFATAAASTQAIGLSFGGCAYGHGVQVSGGTARIKVNIYSIQ